MLTGTENHTGTMPVFHHLSQCQFPLDQSLHICCFHLLFQLLCVLFPLVHYFSGCVCCFHLFSKMYGLSLLVQWLCVMFPLVQLLCVLFPLVH